MPYTLVSDMVKSMQRFIHHKLLLMSEFEIKNIKNNGSEKVREKNLERNFGDLAVGRRVSVRTVAEIFFSFR